VLTITNNCNGYSILLSEPGTGTRGIRVQAENVAEIVETVQHYYTEPYHREGRPNCPLCRRRD
jgi:hypothetical protein